MAMIGNWCHLGCSPRAVKRQRHVVGRQRGVNNIIHSLRFILLWLIVVQFWSSYKISSLGCSGIDQRFGTRHYEANKCIQALMVELYLHAVNMYYDPHMMMAIL